METKHQAPLLYHFPGHNLGSPSLDTQRLQTQPNTDTPISNLTSTFIVQYLPSLLFLFVAFKSFFSFSLFVIRSKSKASDGRGSCRQLSQSANSDVLACSLECAVGRVLLSGLFLSPPLLFSTSLLSVTFFFLPFCSRLFLSESLVNSHCIAKGPIRSSLFWLVSCKE